MRECVIAILSALLVSAIQADAFNGALWVNRGPTNISGVVLSMLIDPDQPDVYLAGTGGGLFTSTDAGASWTPGSLPPRAVFGLARDPNHHDTLWAATDAIFGEDALFKSVDRGRTWTAIAAAKNERAFSVAVTASGAVLVANTRGLVVSQDGSTFRATAFPLFDFAQVHAHPTDGNRAIAILGKSTSAGVRAAAFVTADGGVSWHEASGIDTSSTRGITVAFAPSQPATVYAFATGVPYQDKGVLYRSDDSGETFRRVATSTGNVGDRNRVLTLFVSPLNPNMLATGAVLLYRSVDGGLTDERVDRIDAQSGNRLIPHMDYHGMAADPRFSATSRRVIVWGDGGVYRTDDLFATQPTWQHLTNGLTNSEIYSFDVNAAGSIVAGMQDVGVAMLRKGMATATSLADGDFYHVAFDPTDDNVYFSESFPGRVYRSTQSWSPLVDSRAGQSPYASDFTIDPNQPSRLFEGSATVVRADLIQTSQPIITTLRTNATGTYTTAIAVQRGDSNVLWFADNLGAVYRTASALSSAPQFAQKIKVPLTDGSVVRIVIDSEDPSRVMIVCRNAIELTRDNGATWRSITTTAPAAFRVASIEDAVRHPKYPDWLYVATIRGLWSTTDGGATWTVVDQPLLQTMAITRIFFVPGTTTIVASTYGRGLWSADIPPILHRRRAV